MTQGLLPEYRPSLKCSLYFRLQFIMDWQNTEMETMRGTLDIMVRIRSVYILKERFKLKCRLKEMEQLHIKLFRYQYYLALLQKDKSCKTHSPKGMWLVNMVRALARTLTRAK